MLVSNSYLMRGTYLVKYYMYAYFSILIYYLNKSIGHANISAPNKPSSNSDSIKYFFVAND